MFDLITAQRLIVLGRNSKVWALLKESQLLSDLSIVAIGHAELLNFKFCHGDNVWVFSYSRSTQENRLLLEILSRQQNISVVYISSASTNVTSLTGCYSYPTVKQQAMKDAVRLCGACVVNIGWFYANPAELPSGNTAATSVDALAMAMRSVDADIQQTVNIFQMIDRPFASKFEKFIYQFYGAMLMACGRYPCLLRPIDFLLRAVGMRWYGYLYLSNNLWSMTI